MSTLGAVTLLGRFLSPPRHPRPSRRQSDSENFLLSAFWPRRNCLPERFCSSPGRRLMVPAPQLGGGDARPRRRGLALPRPLGVTAPGDLGTHVCGPGAHLPGSSRWRSRGPAKRSELAGRSAFAPAQAALRKLFQPSPIPPQPPPAPRSPAQSHLRQRRSRPRRRSAPGSGGQQQPRAPRPGAPQEHHRAQARAPAGLSRPSSAPAGWPPALSVRAARPEPPACPRLPAPRRRAGGGLRGGCVPLPAALRARPGAGLFSFLRPKKKEKGEGR